MAHAWRWERSVNKWSSIPSQGDGRRQQGRQMWIHAAAGGLHITGLPAATLLCAACFI